MMADPPSRLSAIIAELRRRRVFRVAVFYGGIAFVIVQIIDGTCEVMGIPAWVSRLLIILLSLGFPVAMGLAWGFDITDKGIVRTKGPSTSSGRPEKQAPRPFIGNPALGIIASLAILVAVWSWWGRPSAAGTITSIAVLPLNNLMGDPDQDYFVDGMHEAIISNLSRLSALRVISRTSAMRYKDTDKLLPEIARELDVDALVEGSVLKAGNRVRITAQLIHGASDEHLWSNDYEGDLTDILSLQKTVARAIAMEIGLALKPEEEAYLASAPQVNPEAYNLYLKGWYFRNLASEESMPRAIEYLEQAVVLDPEFARAWAALGHSYVMMQWTGGWDRDYAYNRMKQALDKALELDPNLPEANTGLGIHYQYEVDLLTAELYYRRALELDPNNVYALHEYGVFLSRRGRLDESLGEFRRAQELDPLNPEAQWGIGIVYLFTRQYDKALVYLQAALELAPDNWLTPSNLASAKRGILMQQGRYAEAIAEAEDAGELFDQLRAEWAMGNKEKVYAVRDSLLATGELQRREEESPLWAARLYAIIDEREKALSLLEKAYEDASQWGLWLYDPEFDFLRGEPRFKALMQKRGLTEVFDQNGQRIREVGVDDG